MVWDVGNFNDICEFIMLEMFVEIKMDLVDCGMLFNKIDVVLVEVEMLGIEM